MSQISHSHSHLIRQPIMNLLTALITESDDAFPDFMRWVDEHIDTVEAIAFGDDHQRVPNSGAPTFLETLAFVRMQLEMLEATRTAIGLTKAEEQKRDALRTMEIDLIARTSGPE